MKIPFIDLKRQYLSIKDEIDQAIQSVLMDSAFIGGKYVKSFEARFAEYVGVNHCIGLNSGTDAIYISLRALGVGVGDEVITAANSFIATSEAISMTGAKVVFSDCNWDTYTIDIAKVAAAITSRTKAIVPVHLYGQPADMIELRELSDKHGLYLLEDAAQAHGADISGVRVGSFGHVACFSFYPGKNLGAYGDAGAIVTNDEHLALKCQMIANHGRIKKYDHQMEGLNSRLDGIQAAILEVKLRHLDKWTEERREVASSYCRFLQKADIKLPVVRPDYHHVFHLFVIRVQDRDFVQTRLAEAGIETGIHYPVALPCLPAYYHLNHSSSDFPIAHRCSNEILSLPIYPELTSDQIEYICQAVIEAV